MTASKNTRKLTLTYAVPFLLLISILFAGLLLLVQRNTVEEQMVGLKSTANALVQQIIITRTWNAEHGGVYVEINDRTQPNPYLDDPERDIVSLAGRRYTKLNPAYMTRQIAELARQRHSYRFNLTSLKPLNPGNLPDAWEEIVLRSFEHAAEPQMTVAGEHDARVFRYMVPLVTEQACLPCHAKQQYRLGDIRGGISVAIPMEESDRVYAQRTRLYLIAGLGLWLCIISFIAVVSYILSRKVAQEAEREFELGRLNAIIELAGATAHEIRQPLTVIITYGESLKKRCADNEEIVNRLDDMIAQCWRIDETIGKMHSITHANTKKYVGDIKIIDFDNASGKGDG